MYVCSCFGVTEEQIRAHAAAGACTPRQIASASKAGTDCGSCVRSIQGLLGRGACPRRETAGRLASGVTAAAPAAGAAPVTPAAPVPAAVAEPARAAAA
ncbi:hypothetical protein GCM10010420_47350 [Streptomyces glaucosporus]|uniref:Bacterioferritin-associated ferredoxin n=1 Tax=Streptomyces glaucosporus TaxID=284044 RepID=A0ABP5VYX2_9ACTN